MKHAVIANSSHHLAIDYDRHHPGIVIAITPEPVIGMPGTLIGIVRNPQRKASETISLPKIIGIVLLNVLLGIVLALGPFVLGLLAIAILFS